MKRFLTVLLILVFLTPNLIALAKTYQGTEVLEILPRSAWENSESLRNLLKWYPGEEDKENGPPDYFSIERIIIHDMGCNVKEPGCNNKERDPIEIIQGIYRYQSVTKGWGDIGYHYIIDYWGNVYEGRYGGNGARGAHTYYDRKCDNFNVGTIGIILMGNYENKDLPEVMYNSLSQLVAWLSAANSLDPTDLSHYSEVWHSPQKGSACDISQGGLISNYTGPTVVGHGDIEKGNSDPGQVDLAKVRKEAKQIILNYKNYLFTTKESPKIYTIANGELKEFKSNPANYKIINLSENQLNSFLNPLTTKLSDGALVKSVTRNRVYLIEKNKRRPILSQQLFNIKKYNWNSVISLSDRDLAVYPLSSPLTYPDGSLIKGQGPEVYLVENGKRRHITSPLLFKNRGFKWTNIINISEEELLAHVPDQILFFSDNSLIRGESPEVYLIKSQKRYWIKTGEVFSKLGYRWQDIIQLPQQEINQYALGMVISSSADVAKLSGEKIEESNQEIEKNEEKEEPKIRVGIYSVQNGDIFKIVANGPYEIYKNNQFLALKNKDEIFQTTISQQTNFRFVPKTEDTILEILFYEDRPKWNQSLNDNLFRGIIELKYSDKSKQIWVINELGLEKYLRGVAEAVDSNSIDYLKALMIAARSYAYFHIQSGGKYPNEIFHIRNWSFDQLYKGYGFELRAPNVVKAANETKGMFITYDNKVVRGLYSSDSGGTTKNACQLWGGVFCEDDYKYLRGGIKDPAGTVHSSAAIIASHGVGISAAGARRLAELGKTYEEILKYYYQGINIEKLY